jgi:hypothetical protein
LSLVHSVSTIGQVQNFHYRPGAVFYFLIISWGHFRGKFEQQAPPPWARAATALAGASWKRVCHGGQSFSDKLLLTHTVPFKTYKKSFPGMLNLFCVPKKSHGLGLPSPRHASLDGPFAGRRVGFWGSQLVRMFGKGHSKKKVTDLDVYLVNFRGTNQPPIYLFS